MVPRLCFDERTRIEVLRKAQLSVAVIAERLGRGNDLVSRVDAEADIFVVLVGTFGLRNPPGHRKFPVSKRCRAIVQEDPRLLVNLDLERRSGLSSWVPKGRLTVTGVASAS